VVEALWVCAAGFMCALAGWSVVARWTRPRRLDRQATSMRLGDARPGYYLDPLGDSWWRYWDGDNWTSETCADRFPPRYGTMQQVVAASEFDDVTRNLLRVPRRIRERIDFALIGAAIGFPLALLAIPGYRMKGAIALWAILIAASVTAVFAFNSRGAGRTKTRP
jgi:Protein of unknown function (DUF2510)